MRHVKVAAGYDGFAGLALERVQKAAVGIVPGHTHVDARELILCVGRVDIHKPEFVELERADAALGCDLGDEHGRLASAGVGQQRIGAQYAQRLLAAKDRGARIAFTLGVAPGLVIAGQVNIDLAFLQLGLLQCQDIDVEFLRDLDKARVLFEHGAQAVDVPRGESVSLRHGVLSTGLAGLRLAQQGRWWAPRVLTQRPHAGTSPDAARLTRTEDSYDAGNIGPQAGLRRAGGSV